MTWNPDDLRRIREAEELQISSTRPDGTDRPFVTIWSVCTGGELYVRSAYGTDNPWYRRAIAAGTGTVRAGGVEQIVSFTPIDPEDQVVQNEVDAAYQAKYATHPPRIVATVIGEIAHLTTIRVDPL